MHQPVPPARLLVPSLIKRNTALFALSQSFTGVGMQFAYGIGPLIVVALTGSAGLAGLFVGMMGLSRFLVSYPLGKVTDTFGRKPGIQLGLLLACAGTICVGLSVGLGSAAVLIVGMVIFGMGMSAAQQMRVAATDMFPPPLRAQALGYVALGSLVGMVISPMIIALSEWLAPRLGQDPLGLPWLLQPALIVAGIILVTYVRPDPKTIGQRLADYYPGYQPPSRPPAGLGSGRGLGSEPRADFSAAALLRYLPARLAIVSNCAAHGNMAIVMVLTSLVLHHHGHSLTAIAASHMFHSAGMFAFTIPLGRLADRLGRNVVMYPGVATTLVGAGLVTFTPSFWSVTLGTFLVGLGWAAANVAATALIADLVETDKRGRAIGINDSVAGGLSVVLAVLTGPLIEWNGLAAAGVTAVLVALVPLVMLAASRLVR